MIAEEDYVTEAMQLETPGGVFDDLLERILRHRDCPREAQVSGGLVDGAFGHVSQYRRDERVSQPGGDLAGEQTYTNIVLANRHVRTVLLSTADRQDDRGLARGDKVAQFGPGQILDKYVRRAGGARGRRERE